MLNNDNKKITYQIKRTSLTKICSKTKTLRSVKYVQCQSIRERKKAKVKNEIRKFSEVYERK